MSIYIYISTYIYIYIHTHVYAYFYIIYVLCMLIFVYICIHTPLLFVCDLVCPAQDKESSDIAQRPSAGSVHQSTPTRLTQRSVTGRRERLKRDPV